jgi:DNA (cytosine-5)-methyltransferase 1
VIPTTGGHFSYEPIALAENTIGRKPENGGNGDGFTEGGSMYTLNATGVHGVMQPIAYALDSLASNSMKSANPASGCNVVDVSKALDTSRGLDPSCNQGGIAVAQPIGIFQDSEYGVAQYDNAGTLRAGRIPEHQMVMQPIATHAVAFEENFDAIREVDVAPAMTTEGYRVSQNAGGLGLRTAMQVRRLSPKECERLQGFPDNYTDIKLKGKPTPDGPRYKALGNSMAVPVMAWIGTRIQEVDAILKNS